MRSLDRRGSEDFGIQDYKVPKVGAESKARAGFIPKNKSPGPIEAEAKFRKNIPGVGAYDLPETTPWTERGGKKATHPSLEKAPRLMMADIVARNSSKPEKSTPSPLEYSPNKDKFLPTLDRGGAALLSS